LLNEAKLNKLKAAQSKATKKTEEALILAMDYLECAKSDCRWKLVEQAKSIYLRLTSESAKLKAVREKILIRKLGFGWSDCGHKWSENGYHNTSKDLLDHLIKTVIPLESKCSRIPSEPPTNISSGLSNDYMLGTEMALKYKDEKFNVKSTDEIRRDAEEESNRRKTQHEID